ncbi:MAG: cation-transporting P-type ATPase, partial [Acidobacteria bacterium]|nr:cation-transporting P-type ATPase [Acidobacteriota bacterium]
MADLDDHRPATEAPVPAAWARPATEVAGVLEVDPAAGLSRAEVAERRRRYGENRLREARRRTAFEILFAQLRSLVVGLLGAAAAASFVFGDWVEGIAIVAVLVLNTLLGFVTELRAVRSMEALRRMGSVEARVRRAGGEELVPAQELVPGDVVLLDEGDVVTADLRLLEANGVEA